MKSIGFVGMGNMGQALAGGFVRLGATAELSAYAPDQEKLKANCERLGIFPAGSIEELVGRSEILLIACKPYQIEAALDPVKDRIKDKPIVSVAAGWDHDKYAGYLGDIVKVQYIMPNTPAAVGEGVFLFEEKNSLPEEDRNDIMELFSSMGMVKELPTALMGIGMAVTGCGPAFVDMMIEAYADAAVKYGIGRQTAYELVSRTVLGAAKQQLVTKKHPGQLKDEVCSPGGTTIRGVAELEKSGFRNACIASIDAIMRRS